MPDTPTGTVAFLFTDVQGSTAAWEHDRTAMSAALRRHDDLLRAAPRDLGEHRLRDLARPERVFQLLAPGLTSDFPPLTSLDARPNNLPLAATSFVGRQREIADLGALLGSVRLLTLTGPGGTGKTRLALQLAADQLPHFPDGAFFIDLAPLQQPDLVVNAAAVALGLREDPGRPLLDTLLDALRTRKLLLVLDNCEHVLDAAARLADAIVRSAPDVRLLATSREPLGIPGEVAWPVPPLALPDPRHATADALRDVEAVRLFVDRAVAARPDFAVTNANAAAVAELCTRLDGIPLALELAAARVRAFSPEEIARRLDERFRLLTGGSRVAMARHQTLRACLDWSYDLLGDTDRRVLQRLSVFAGRFPLSAAEVVCADDAITDFEVVDAVVNLEARSLVVAEPVGDGTEYRLLETIRAYAREHLAASGDDAATRDRHLAWCLALAEEAEPHLTTAEAGVWLDVLGRRHDDLRAALDWALTDEGGRNERALMGVRLCVALWRFWGMHTHLREMALYFPMSTAVSRRCGEIRLTARCLYMGAWPWLVTVPHDPRAAITLLNEALDIFISLDMLCEAAWANSDIGNAYAQLDDLATAEVRYRIALDLKRRSSSVSDIASGLINLAEILRARSSFSDARATLHEALSLEIADRVVCYSCYHNLGLVELRLGLSDSGSERLREALRMSDEGGDRRWTTLCVGSLAGAAALAANPQRAARLQGATVTMAARSGILAESVDQRDWDHFTALARTLISPAEWDVAYAEGRAMSEEVAVAYALAAHDNG